MIVDYDTTQNERMMSPIRDFINKKKIRDSSLDNMRKGNKNNQSFDDNNYYSDDDKKFYKNLKIKNNSENKEKKFRILEPFRSLGLVVDENKVQSFMRNQDRLLLASNYHSFLIYNLDKLKLERISPPLAMKITAMTMYKNKVFTAVGDKILLWEKIHIIQQFEINEKNSDFYYRSLLTFDNLLLALTSNGDMHIFDIYKGKLVKTLLNLNIDLFIHPQTYLNKILFTKLRENYEEDLNLSNGKLYLFNINTEKQIFECDLGYKNGEQILTIEQSPVIDVIGIGMSNGDIIIFNLKSLKKILIFKSENPVTNLSFSNCHQLNLSLLASTTQDGKINLWDLNKQSLHYTIKNHFNLISQVMFIPNCPILLATSAGDNSIKMFKLELLTGTPQLLKMRNGHSTNPHKIRFYGNGVNNESHHLLSISQKEIRNISILNEHMSRDFSMSYKNLPSEIRHELGMNYQNNLIDFDFNEFRQRDWSNVLINLKGHSHPLLFSYENSTVNDVLANLKTKSNCTSINVSMCGNFGFCGFENGNLEKFNMQSGRFIFTIEKAHDKAIIGIKTDGINSMIVTISLDMTLKFWDFFQSSLIKKVDLISLPKILELNRDNDLIAIGLSNSSIQVYDKSNFKMVREFNKSYLNKLSQINDLTFSRDGKWLLQVSDDKSLKIYDVLSGNLIEWITFKHIPVSCTISPDNQHIAVSFHDLKGIYLFINRTLYIDLIDTEVNSPLVFDVIFHDGFRTRKTRKEINDEEKLLLEASLENLNLHKKSDLNLKSSQKIQNNNANTKLIQLSNENRLKFRILNHLEKIQEKNMPKIKRKEKAKAPFFLFNVNETTESSNTEQNLEFMNLLKNYTHFKNEKMVNGKNNTEKKELILMDLLELYENKKISANNISTFLNGLNPYLIDLEIRNLDPLFSIEKNYLIIFLDYILEEILLKRNFELVQAYLNRFLKIFTEYSIKDKIVKNKLEKINREIEESFNDMESLFNNTMCLVSHFGKIQI